MRIWTQLLLLFALGAVMLPAQETGEPPAIDDVRYEARQAWNKVRRAYDRRLRDAEAGERPALEAKRNAELEEILAPLWTALDRTPQDKDAPKALLWVLRLRKFDPAPARRAAKLFAARHADHADAYRAARTLAGVDEEWATKPLAQLRDKGGDRTQAWARYALVARALAAAKTPVAEDKHIAALKTMRKQVAKHADLLRAIELKLKPYRLAAGRLAPEITGVDLDGTDFKLSDYRGKVVLLDFWGTW